MLPFPPERRFRAMYLNYLILGLIGLAVLIWVFFALPKDDRSSDDDDEGGTHAGGDGYPVNPPPSIVVNVPDRDRTPRTSTST